MVIPSYTLSLIFFLCQMGYLASSSATNAGHHTGTDSDIITAGWEPTEENEDERDKNPSHSGSGIDDDEDFISSTSKNNQLQ